MSVSGPDRPPDRPPVRPHLLLLSGADEADVRGEARLLADGLERRIDDGGDDETLGALAAALRDRDPGIVRCGVVAADLGGACDGLRGVARPGSRLHRTDRGRRTTAFLCPGVGDQYPGMIDGLTWHPAVAEVIERCTGVMPAQRRDTVLAALRRRGGNVAQGDPFAQMLRRPAGLTGEDHGATAQLVTFVTTVAMLALWESLGIRPDVVLGYSLGEYAAAVAAGVLALEDATRLVTERVELFTRTPPGRMITVAARAAHVSALLAGIPDVTIGAVLGPQVCVASGTSVALDALEERLRAAEIVAVPVAGSQPLHGPLMTPAADELTRIASRFEHRPPRIGWLSNVTGTWMPRDGAPPPDYWAAHLCRCVQFDACVSALLDAGAVRTIEVGPGQALSSFVRQHPRCGRDDLRHIIRSLPGRHDGASPTATMLAAAGDLWAQGMAVEWDSWCAPSAVGPNAC